MLANISYKITVFADFSVLKPEPSTVIEFLQEFTDYNLMPAVADNLQLGNMAMPNFVFALEQNYKKIMIFNNRIDFLCVAKETEGFHEDEISQITVQAADLISRIIKKCRNKGQRLGIYKEFVLYQLSSEENKKFAKEKFGFIPYYADSEIIECGIRTVARESIKIKKDTEELCNMITTINRINVDGFENPHIEGFKIDFDLNTYQGNTTPRFEIEEIKNFCTEMNTKAQLLIGQIAGDY